MGMLDSNSGGKRVLKDTRKKPTGGTPGLPKHNKLSRQTYMIPARALSVKWLQAQRPYDAKWAELIRDNFDADLFDDVIVTRPDINDVHHIVEGQHRVAVCTMLWGEDTLVPCRVIDVTDPATAAKVWAKINKAKKPAKPIELFKIETEAGKEANVDITSTLQGVGLHIGRKARGTVAAVRACEYAYGLGPTVLERTFNLLKRAYGDHRDAYVAAIIRGTADFVVQHGNKAHLKRLAEAIQRDAPNPTTLLGMARTDIASRSITEGVTASLILLYNRRLKKEARLERYK